MLRTRLTALVLVAVVAGGLVACNRGKEATVPRATTTTSAAPSEAASITADEYSFTVAGTLTADRTTIAMRNDGDELHEWKFARLRPEADINQASAALQGDSGGGAGTTTTTATGTSERTTTSRASRSGIRGQATTSTTDPPPTTQPPTTPPPTQPPTTPAPTSPPTTVRRTTTTVRRATTTAPGRRTTTTRRSTTGSTIPSDAPATGIDAVFEDADLGAPGSLLSPGEANTVSGDLDAGKYAVFCMIKGSDGATHVSKGMIAEVTVEDAGEPPADPPTDRSVTITDGRIDVGAKDFKAGRTTFELTNGGEQKHNFSVIALNEGETLRSFSRYVGAAFSTGLPATAPGRIVAGVDTFESGDRIKVSLDLKPGTYTVACTYRDPEGSEDHLSAFGEQTTITVT